MRKILLLLAAFLCATACIYPYSPELEEAPEGVLSVDGNICIGSSSTVRLGTLLSLWKAEWKPADFSDARVWVEDDAGGGYPGEQVSDWLFSIDTRNAPRDRRYRLCVEALGDRYVSEWNDVLPPPVIRDISFSADEEDVHVAVSVDGGDGGTGYALLSYEETWEFHADYFLSYEAVYDEFSGFVSVGKKRTPDMSRYWCWRTVNNNQSFPVDYTGQAEGGFTGYPLLSFSRRDNRNHLRYCVSVTARTISRDTYRFLHNLQENTSGGDNLFTPNPGEIGGNLRCEGHPERTVLGYAVFSSATSKRAFLDSRYRKPVPQASLQYPLSQFYKEYLDNDYLPLVENDNPNSDPEKEGPYGWGGPRCYDCTAVGGTQTKPDYWDDFRADGD